MYCDVSSQKWRHDMHVGDQFRLDCCRIQKNAVIFSCIHQNILILLNPIINCHHSEMLDLAVFVN